MSLSPSAVELEYRVAPQWWQVLLGAGAFGLAALCAFFMRELAACLASGLLCAAIVSVWAFRFGLGQFVRVTASHLIVPRSDWSRDEVAFRWEDLMASRSADGYLEVEELVGERSYTIWANQLPSQSAFERVTAIVLARVRHR